MYLLDVNILIAVADADHEHHERATEFFLTRRSEGWATCPITENGFIRIIGNPNYPKGPGSTGVAQSILADLCAKPNHHFWPDDITLRNFPNLPGTKKLTDHYLLALAIHRNGKLATMDRRIDPSSFVGAESAYLIIP